MTDGSQIPSPPAADAARDPGRWFSFETLVSGLNSIGTLWIFALMFVISLDVIGRTAFNAPLPGVLELVRLSIVGIVFIQLAHTLRAGRITRADNLLRLLQNRWPRIGYGLQAAFGLAGAALFAVLFHASYPFLLSSWASGEYAGIEGYISYPVWPVRLIILVGSVSAGIQFLLFAYRDFSVAIRGRLPTAGEVEAAESAAYRAED